MSGASIQCCKELKACLSLDTSTSVKIWRAEKGKLPLARLLGRSVLLPPPPPLRALASSGEGVARGRNKRRWRGCGDVRGDGVADGAESLGAARRRWIGDSAEQGRCRLGWRQRQQHEQFAVEVCCSIKAAPVEKGGGLTRLKNSQKCLGKITPQQRQSRC